MKKLISAAIIIVAMWNANAQGIGEMAPPKPPDTFPDNAWGVDIMFSEGGFGLGTFYRHQMSDLVTGFVDLSFSEAQDPREFTYVDYYGNSYTLGKLNRAFILPLNFGVQYRLFEDDISDNLRPYINFGVGPALVINDPYELEFFTAFKRAHLNYSAGGYIGFGANFGLNKTSLVGLNVRYYYVHLFNKGVEIMQDNIEKDLGGIYITLNIGKMY
jgi:hypothetical protein